jgi:hypothetical protein
LGVVAAAVIAADMRRVYPVGGQIGAAPYEPVHQRADVARAVGGRFGAPREGRLERIEIGLRSIVLTNANAA